MLPGHGPKLYYVFFDGAPCLYLPCRKMILILLIAFISRIIMKLKSIFTIALVLIFYSESWGGIQFQSSNIPPSASMLVYEPKDQLNDNNEFLKKLPLVITTSKFQNKDIPVAFLISGDGGWFGFEQSIADNLSSLGIPTIGLDSRKYFWKRKTPEETAGDVTEALNYYCKEWGRERFFLVGYSLGSEIVPFIVTRLSAEMQSKIVSAVLLSPETDTDFEIHISNMLGMGNRQNTYNVSDEIIKMQAIHTLIIFGEGEKSKVPESVTGTTAKIVKIPGDHHYKFNLTLIIQTMKDNKAF
jgi:type IV secretory pathway VirJ component